MSKLAENLKKLMNSSNINASELARNTGVSQPVINRIVNGLTTNPNVGTLSPLACYFSISISELIGDTQLPSLKGKGVYIPHGSNAQNVPLISWQEATKWSGRSNITKRHKIITTNKGISEFAFALLMDDDIDSRFPKGTLLIVEPAKKLSHRDYVIVQQEKHQVATLKRYILDGENIYLKPIEPDLKVVEFTEKYRIIGVIVQSIFDFD